MNQPHLITLHLQHVSQMLLIQNTPFSQKRALNKEAQDFIVEEALALPKSSEIHLVVYVPQQEVFKGNEVATAVHNHFGYCRQTSEKQLQHTLALGRRSLFIGFSVFCVLYVVATIMDRLLPEGGLATTIHESLVILGWVAMWRPADLLLYDWYPHRQNSKLFRRLEQSKVAVVAETIGG